MRVEPARESALPAEHMDTGSCNFCEIIAKRRPSCIWYEDDEIVVFENRMDWVPLMWLLIPRQHLTQTELWNDGRLLAKMGKLAVRLGEEHSTNGFRILSNFGSDGLQTQYHAHLHLLGGTYLGHYVRRKSLEQNAGSTTV